MTSLALPKGSTNELVAQFVEIGLAQYDALLGGDTRLFNRLYDKMRLIELELKSRPGDQRSQLLPQLNHPNLAVRWKAATATLAIAPQAARQALESVAKSGEMPIAGHAASTLSNFDSGFFIPT